MNILWLDHASRVNRHDKWLHTDFAKKLEDFGHKLFFYAPAISTLEKEHTPIEYDARLLMKDIVKQLDIHCIIVDTRSAMYDNYFPKTVYPERPDVGNMWLPKDFPKIDTLKICIEEDYHYEYSDRWYEEMGFKAILQKHYSQAIRKMLLPVISFPFSVDTSIFHPSHEQRLNKVCLAGTCIDSVYVYRHRAMQKLQEAQLIDAFTCMQKVGDNYVKCLQQYVCHLSGGSRYSLTPAKVFEIVASGSVLLTNKFMGIEKVLPDDCYVSYKNDASDVVVQVNHILNDNRYRDDMVKKGLAHIQKYHTHEIRIKQLIGIIKQFYGS